MIVVNMEKEENKNSLLLSVILLVTFAALMFGAITIGKGQNKIKNNSGLAMTRSAEGTLLPIVLNDLGPRMVQAGVIDSAKFVALYEQNPEMQKIAEDLLSKTYKEEIIITPQNAPILLNYFWALGLGNKNEILEKGEMSNPAYGGPQVFASTGGWDLAIGNSMNHYSMHQFILLSPEEQILVDRVSENIFRPCCGNSTHFPDCNHGMAMLAYLELAASQGASESDLYQGALILNSYWFPDQYRAIAEYMKQKEGIEWKDVDPKVVLGAEYSSAEGFQNIASQVILPKEDKSRVGCSTH